MADFIIKELITNDIEKELSRIGFDGGHSFIAADKFRYKNFKIYSLTPEQANIIKQTALSVGADSGTHREVIRGKVDNSDVILGGSYSQLKKIAEKLKHQPFSLKILAEAVEKQLTQSRRETKIVGILNVTPDSFSDGGKYTEPKNAEKHLIQLIEDGADMIDIGAESTRPGANEVEAEEQIRRLKPIIKFIKNENITLPISVDTRSSVVADYVLNNGVSVINDVSGFDYDIKLAEVVSKYNAGIIIQHSKGIPQKMQNSPNYENLIDEIYFCLNNKIEYAKSMGITNIVIDPGIGFGKTKENNFEIFNRVEEFYSLNYPIMIGVSSKSLLGVKDNNNDLKDSLTLAISYPLIQKGVDYLRVHNVKLHKALLNTI